MSNRYLCNNPIFNQALPVDKKTVKFSFKYPQLQEAEIALLSRLGPITISENGRVDRERAPYTYELEFVDDFHVYIVNDKPENAMSIFYNGVQILFIDQNSLSRPSESWINVNGLQFALSERSQFTEKDSNELIKQNFSNRVRERLYAVAKIILGDGAERGYASYLDANLTELRKLQSASPLLFAEIIASQAEYKALEQRLSGWISNAELDKTLRARDVGAGGSMAMAFRPDLSRLNPDRHPSTTASASRYLDRAVKDAQSRLGVNLDEIERETNIVSSTPLKTTSSQTSKTCSTVGGVCLSTFLTKPLSSWFDGDQSVILQCGHDPVLPNNLDVINSIKHKLMESPAGKDMLVCLPIANKGLRHIFSAVSSNTMIFQRIVTPAGRDEVVTRKVSREELDEIFRNGLPKADTEDMVQKKSSPHN